MTIYLHYLEALPILIYLIAILLLGFFTKKKTDSEEDFILGGRQLTLPAFVATLVTTWYGGILGVGEFTYLYGVSNWIVFGLPYYAFALLFAFFLAPKIRSSSFLSIPDQFYKNFGKTGGVGRGGANVKTKMRNLKTGSVVEETIRSGEKFPPAGLEEKKMQYLYAQGDDYIFMDQETYEQLPLSGAQLGNAKLFLKENIEVKILYYKGEPLNVELPTFIELVIARTDPSGFKGDTASGGGKPATLETRAVVRVPFHLNEGDTIKVDTRTSEYIERVK